MLHLGRCRRNRVCPHLVDDIFLLVHYDLALEASVLLLDAKVLGQPTSFHIMEGELMLAGLGLMIRPF